MNQPAVVDEPLFLQSNVCPICRYVKKDGALWIEQLHGTAFLFNSNGFFLTASHVLKKGALDVEENGGDLALFPTQLVNGMPTPVLVPILEMEHAAAEFDISIVRTAFQCPTFFRLGHHDVNVWQEIATLGYPVSVTHKTVEHYVVHQRGHRGYVQRWIRAGRGQFGDNPSSFELNFAITRGLSGAPLFIHKGKIELVVGVCVGSLSAEMVDYETLIVEEGNTTLREKKVRVEEFGIAHDIRPLHEWKAAIAGGKTLLELGQ